MSLDSSTPIPQAPAERVARDIRRVTRRHYSAENKIRIALEGLRAEDSIAAPCWREGIAEGLHCALSKPSPPHGVRVTEHLIDLCIAQPHRSC